MFGHLRRMVQLDQFGVCMCVCVCIRVIRIRVYTRLVSTSMNLGLYVSLYSVCHRGDAGGKEVCADWHARRRSEC